VLRPKARYVLPHGIPIGANTSQADVYGEFRAEKEVDLHVTRVGDERYQVADAVIFGGQE
jgi:hypothetical protein